MKHFKKQRKFAHDERGNGMVTALIASAIVMVAATTLMRLHSNSMRAQKRSEMLLDRESVVHAIREQIDCQQTLSTSPMSCSGGSSCAPGDTVTCPSGTSTNINIFRRGPSSGMKLIDATSAANSKMGGWTLRARCTPTGLDIKAVRMRNGATNMNSSNPADYLDDPLTGNKKYDFNHPKSDLFPAGSEPCGNYFAISTSGACQQTCPTGQVITSVDFSAGCVTCTAMVPITTATCPPGQFPKGYLANGNPNCSSVVTLWGYGNHVNDAGCPSGYTKVGAIPDCSLPNRGWWFYGNLNTPSGPFGNVPAECSGNISVCVR